MNTDRGPLAPMNMHHGQPPHAPHECELCALTEELAAARALYSTFDPDSPGWSGERELRRLEVRWNEASRHAELV